MKWIKKGLIYTANDNNDWAYSHAMIPTPFDLNESTIRIFLTFCDRKGIGRVGFVDVDKINPKRIINVSEKPLFEIGRPGTFDESGALVCSVVKNANKIFLYYVGFELGLQIRYRLLTGLAVCDINKSDLIYNKYKEVPILERSDSELFFRCGPFCLKEKNIFRMWYVAGSDWELIDGKSMPVYTINYMESIDGINWPDKGLVCINITHNNEHGFGRPYIIKDDDIYKMYYSIRIKQKGYRLGYAESDDGITWERKDNEIGIGVSEDGWDSEMICYSAIFKANNKTFMFYNGNQFGKTGFGYAELADE